MPPVNRYQAFRCRGDNVARKSTHGVRDKMSIFLSVRLYASSHFHRFGWEGLVQTPSDDLTPATVLAVNPLSPVGHIVAHFNDREIASTRLKEISNGMV
jgi:hypothetical protein